MTVKFRFQSPLVAPDVRVSRIRRSDEAIMRSPTESCASSWKALRAPGFGTGIRRKSGSRFPYSRHREIGLVFATLVVLALATVLRLLLGLEQPVTGQILYDGHDLNTLDIEAVRSQVGVVLQNGRLVQGDLFSNIAGHWKISLEEAWKAVRKVGLEDEIRALPMQLHTPVGDALSTFSTGQQQRLRIARAIVQNPPLLYLDEATSALDNRTQNSVSESLDAMQMGRLVIAHRLSTIRNADRIYYLERGRVIERGSYDELMRQNGRFAELAERQLVKTD